MEDSTILRGARNLQSRLNHKLGSKWSPEKPVDGKRAKKFNSKYVDSSSPASSSSSPQKEKKKTTTKPLPLQPSFGDDATKEKTKTKKGKEKSHDGDNDDITEASQTYGHAKKKRKDQSGYLQPTGTITCRLVYFKPVGPPSSNLKHCC